MSYHKGSIASGGTASSGKKALPVIEPQYQQLGMDIISKHENFVPMAFNLLRDSDFIESPFDKVINEALDKTFTGEIKRLIINIPPRHGKTLRAVQAYVARGYAINNKANFIHTSYSASLVHDNSVAIRDIISHPDYQTLYPHVQFKQDTKAKGLWKTTAGGTFLASPAGGAIVGFGAGIIGAKTFSGAMIIDDPVKPDDARHETVMNFINSRWENVFKSRLADQNTPVIVIMQRISEGDFTSELLERSGSDEEWHHLILPAYISKETFEYKQSGKLIEHDLPDGPLMPIKFTEEQAKAAMSNIQWSQEPEPMVGETYQREWFKRFDKLPTNIKSWSIYCDTATKTNKYNDYSVFQLWAKTTSNQGYLAAQWRKKVQVPFLKKNLVQFYDDAVKLAGTRNIKISIEDKDSGQGLIQTMRLDTNITIVAIKRTEGKYARAVKATPQVLAGNIFIMEGPVGDGVITECVKFMTDDSHKNDDQVDPLNDFINFELPQISAITPQPISGGY